MSDRMLEICSGIVFVLIVFTLFLVLVGWLDPIVHFAKGVAETILVVGGSLVSGTGFYINKYRYQRHDDSDLW